ncbi:hypothetical protein D3C84_1265020 [compost metagenome]
MRKIREHFSVDGTLLQAWASQKSFRPKDDPPDTQGPGPRNAQPDFKGQKRSNDTLPRPAIRMLGCTAKATTPVHS